MQPLHLIWRNKTSQITLKSMLAAGGLLVSGLFLIPHSLNGQEVAGAPENYQTRPSPHFKPNKGQVADHEGNLIKAYEYVYQAPGMKVGLTQNGFHYNLYTVEEKPKKQKNVSEATGKPAKAEQQPERPGDEEAKKQRIYHYHRVEVAFKGANEDPEIIAEEKMDYYANYYLGYLPEYVTQVHGYRKLTYKNLYDNIDLVLRPSTAENGRRKLKYNIRVRPGGDLSDVKMVYKGMDKLSLEDGKLQIATSQGRMTETIPKSYWAESKEATAVNYQLEGNTVSFQAEQQQEGRTLVLDPSLSWSTYLGGGARDLGDGVTTDGSGNVYVTGNAQSGYPRFPTTSGAYQTSYGGGFTDAFLSKFTSSGSLSWSTYLGGSELDQVRGVTTDGSGNVYVTGYARPDDYYGFPTTPGAYQTSSSGGSSDAFLSKFSSSGSLSWSTFLGGGNGEQGNGVTTDGSGNVYVTGFAEAGFPTTSGAYQTSNAGNGDAFLGTDAFLSKFTSSGSLSWSTYLGGGNDDGGIGVTTDGSGNVYVTGNANSGFPTTSGAYQPSYGGGFNDAFLSKFSSRGSLSYSTFLGGSGDDRGKGVTTDGSGNVYVTGDANSGFPTTSGAYQPSNAGGDDAFLSKFTSSGSLSYSTYLGGGNDETGQGVTTDGSGNVYVTGGAKSGFPTTSGAYQQSNAGRDAFVTKFPILNAALKSDSGCAGKALSFVDTSSLLGSDTINQYDWNFGDGSSGSGRSVSHTYSSAGNYTVELIVTTANGLKDTATKKAKVYPTPTASFTVNDSAQCQRNNSFQFTDQSTISAGSLAGYKWSFGDGASSQSYNPSHQYSNANGFTVGLSVTSNQGCEDSISQQVKVNPSPSASFSINERVQCLRDSFQFTDQSTISAGSLAGYKWSFGDGASSQRQNPSHQYSSANIFTVGLSVTSDQGCEDSITQQVKVNLYPSASFSINDRVQCQRNNSFQFTDQSTISAGSLASYEWSFGDGTSSQRQNPNHQYSNADSFTVSLIATSDQGCEDTASQPVTVNPTPTSDFTINKVNYETVSFEAIDTTLANYQWIFGDGDIGVVAKPTKAYDTNGIYNVRLVTTTDNGCRDTTVKPVTMANTGVNLTQERTGISFQAYPNPFSEDIAVSYKLPTAKKDVQLLIVDQAGSTIGKHVYGRQSAGRHTYQLQALQEASPGTYFIRLKLGGDKQQVERVVKVE